MFTNVSLCRPTSLVEFKGNYDVKAELYQMIVDKKRPKGILINGKGVCGKTSLARLLVKVFSEAEEDTVNNFIKTGDTSLLFDTVSINNSLSCRYVSDFYEGKTSVKVVIMDDAHFLTDEFQHDLVAHYKEDSVYIICTDSPSLLIDELLNFCEVQFDLKPLTEDEMLNYLIEYCLKNKATIGVDTLKSYIVKDDMRQTLTNFYF